MSALEKLLRLSGSSAAPAEVDPDAELLLAAQLAARELSVLLATQDDPDDGPDDDEDDDNSGGKGGGGGDHSGHATYKALMQKNVPPKKAAAMCAKADSKVKASALAESLVMMLAGRPGREISLLSLSAPASEAAAVRKHAISVVLELAKGGGGQLMPMHHPPFTGTHSHGHHLTAAHDHEHQHFNDNTHDGGPQHRPGSQPRTMFGAY